MCKTLRRKESKDGVGGETRKDALERGYGGRVWGGGKDKERVGRGGQENKDVRRKTEVR